MHTVRIPGSQQQLLVKFPEMCCCCADLKVHGYYRARTKHEIYSRRKIAKIPWRFPICQKCLEWADSCNRREDTDMTFFLMLVLGFLTTAAGIASMFFLGLLGLLMVIPGVLLGAGSLFVIKTELKIRSRKQIAKPYAVCSFPPVLYIGWSKYIHTFEIANLEFCQEFQRVNSK
ncbi:hypothetical protein NIES4074_36290 [Cylindrospermum sp. NIES-4074]|nr:hypothetical protein NIES4074_36290 [Cylindrospermum sp. NIES-4074]